MSALVLCEGRANPRRTGQRGRGWGDPTQVSARASASSLVACRVPRPVDADPAQTYDAIVAAALELLHTLDQPDQLSMRKVASRADVSVGTIQYYFESKTDLLEACLDGYYDRLNRVAMELIGAVGDRTGVALIEDAARSLYRFAVRERALIRLRVATNASLGELHPRRQPEFLGDAIRAGAAALAPHITISPTEARLAIQGLVSIMVRMALLTDSELEVLTDRSGHEGRAEVEAFVVRAAVRLLQPIEG